MNCRLGDLAIVVNDFENPENNGALLKIVAHALPGQWDIPADWNCIPLSTFRFDDKVVSPGRGVLGYRDRELRPLRDSDGQDQTLDWAGHPTERHVATA
ncbi:hypothetical protein [Comamonas testosteroni]|uniref:hypothetical protein n=1 Tax=Comamonas testosteroni TaxID=285 RepID=UPI000A5FB85F|nr:hypothetical protein [Comamonas testosteroni]